MACAPVLCLVADCGDISSTVLHSIRSRRGQYGSKERPLQFTTDVCVKTAERHGCTGLDVASGLGGNWHTYDIQPLKPCIVEQMQGAHFFGLLDCFLTQ
jgi:hypothetical protein|eukprot:COSAG02_NODE_1018_length_15181_cov_18.026389_4_plen_99_part_00